MRDPSGGLDLRSHDFPKPLFLNVWSLIIMSRLFQSDSQNFACSRRELPGKLFVIVGALLLPKSQVELPRSQVESSTHPLPEFNVGDLVAQDWNPEDDDAPESATDFGEILGMRWIPEPDGYCSIGNTWVYYIRWTHSTCPGCLTESYCDGEPTYSSDLRLATAEEVCKH